MSDFTDFLKSAAPLIGTALGGPLGGLAVSVAAKALGVEPNQNAIMQAVSNDPDAILKLKQADYEFALKMAQNDTEDRKSARDREATVKDWMPSILATLIVTGYFAVNYIIFTVGVPLGTSDYVLRSLGTLDGLIFSVIGYYFGAMHTKRT